jgi:hypothetical protein
MIQGGDFERHDGTGGQSVYGAKVGLFVPRRTQWDESLELMLTRSLTMRTSKRGMIVS